MREGWDYKLLGDIGKVSMCKRIYKKQTSSSGDIPFYKIGTFGKEPDAFISKDLYEEYRSEYSFPNKGDVLLSASGTIGRRVVYNGEPAYFQDSNIVWIANDETEVLNEYLYAFYGFCDWSPSKGATISRLYNDDLRKTKIPIPPLPEQKQIVAILDEVFEAIDQARANVERNIQNAEELFQSKLNEIFSRRGEEWEKKTLEQIALEFGRGKSKHRPRNDERLFGGDYPFIQTGDVRGATKYITEFSQTYNETGLKQSKLWPQGTVCITIAANIAESAILDFDGCFPDSIIGIYVDPEKAHNSYAYYCLQYFKAELQAQGKGSAQDNINLGTFKERYFPFPNKITQKEVAKTLDTLLDNKNALIDQYQHQLENLEELKKSILQKAFSGELTANEHVAV